MDLCRVFVVSEEDTKVSGRYDPDCESHHEVVQGEVFARGDGGPVADKLGAYLGEDNNLDLRR
jgi:hypothetical protein